MFNIKQKGVPHINRSEAILDSNNMVNNPIKVMEKYRKKAGNTFTLYFGGVQPTIVTADPDFIQYVLKTNNTNYNKSSIQVKRMGEFQGIGLLNSHGPYWFQQRRLLSMGFKRSHLSSILPMQIDVMNQFLVQFEKKSKKGAIDIHNEMVHFTLRSVGKSLFGNTMKERDIARLGETVSEIQEFIVKQIVKPYMIPWFRVSGQTEKYQKLRREGDQLVLEYVKKRRKEGVKELDMLTKILSTPYKDTDKYMTDKQISIEILQLLIAGNETSSNAISWSFYLLAKHPAFIKEIREEIQAVFGQGKLTTWAFLKCKEP